MKSLRECLTSSLSEWSIEYRVHATRRMFRRDIMEGDVLNLLKHGIIIEEYLEDFPFPSVLVGGLSLTNRPLHIVLGIDDESNRLYVITVYQPDPVKWTDNLTRRKQ